MSQASQILLIGSGGVGTIAALNIESGGGGHVTAVLRSNYDVVHQKGFQIESCDHGVLKGWRPARIVREVPSATDIRFDYIVVTTKNVPDVAPTVSDMIADAVTPGHTVIVLIQNGLNIEKPIFARFPHNVCLSGVSMIGSQEISPGVIVHDHHDILSIGPFHNTNLHPQHEDATAKQFVSMYSAGGKTQCKYTHDVAYSRWRKLVYNASINSICALTGLDTGQIRLTEDVVPNLVLPAMKEILAAAKASGVVLPADICDTMINVDPLTMYWVPSMLGDIRKGNFTEVETIIGEPLRVGTSLGVAMPTLRIIYKLLMAVQWRTKVSRGLIGIPPKEDFGKRPPCVVQVEPLPLRPPSL